MLYNIIKREYYWLHMISGKSGIREFKELYKGHLLEMCDKWNRQGGKTWKYWVKK